MLLWLVRHGIAVSRDDPDCPPDPLRPLSGKGRERMRDAARGLRLLGVEPELIVTSPYLRALQTAEIISATLQIPGCEIVESPTIEPLSEPQQLLDLLHRCESDAVLCSGHAPHLDRFLAFITTASSPFTSLKKGGTALIELDRLEAGAGELKWLQPPKVLRELGGN